MGTVYLGVHGRRLAAVKTLKAELLDQEHFLTRFRREQQAVAAARHPCVPRLLGAHPAGPVPWIATEYVAGPTLERCVEDHGPLPLDTVRTLGALLASALAALHDAGVVHRDLKPSNVLLDADGPRLVDFGIARMPAATTVTLTGQRPGTPGHMSPEQVLGRELGPPSDVFTLGALLAYAGSGHHAFGAEGHAPPDFAIAYEEPDLSRVPPALARELLPCLDKTPDLRPAAAELARRWGAPDGRPAAPADWLPGHVRDRIGEARFLARESAGRGSLSRRRVLGAAAGVLAVGGAGAWWGLGRDGSTDTGGVPLWDGAAGERPESVWSVSGLDPERPFGPSPAGDVLLVARPGKVSALDPRTGATRWSYPGGRAPAPSASRPLLIGADGRLAELDARTGRPVRRGPGKLDRLLALDADAVYALDTAGHVVAVRPGGTAPRWRTADRLVEPGRAAAGTAGGGLLLVASEDGAVVALDSGTGRRRWAARDGGPRAAVAGGLVILGGGTLRGVDADTGEQRWELTPSGTTSPFGAPLARGGRVYVTDGQLIRCVRAADGEGVWEAQSTGGPYATARPVAAAHGLYVPMADGADGIAAVPLAGDAERYRFTPTAARDAPWAVAAAGEVLALQNGGQLYALPRF
jgi:outer membrane protein assembly factor BamB